MKIIEVKDVKFKYESDTILENLNFEVEKGDYVGIIGLNGSGKTTLVKLILGINPCTQGSININTKKISYVSQSMQNKDLSFPASVFDVVSLGVDRAILTKKDKEKINRSLHLFELYDIRKQLISTLSGGQLQKVKIALALVSDPDLLILDEPTAGMDTESEANFIDYITVINKEYDTTILFISHKKSNLKAANKLFRIENKGLVTEDVSV